MPCCRSQGLTTRDERCRMLVAVAFIQSRNAEPLARLLLFAHNPRPLAPFFVSSVESKFGSDLSPTRGTGQRREDDLRGDVA